MSKAQGLIERKGSVCFFARTPGIRRICCGYCLLPIFLAFFSATANSAVTEGAAEKLVGEIFTFSSAFT